MKKILLLLCAAFSSFLAAPASAQTTIRVFDTVLFFDGYAGLVTNPPPQAGVIRHRNDLYARRLTTQELQSIGSSLSMTVTIKAACDNYDRIGNVNLALVPKGASTYKPDSVQRIEVGRYITPFMNKNRSPNQVPYSYSIDNIANILKETSITTNYDIWVELELFGVPYAAQTQVTGCSGRTDVFYGSLEFVTNAPAPTESTNVLIPLSMKKNLNNYDTLATDTLGKTTRTIKFNVPSNLSDAALFLITSNHGSNSGGEEYNRRMHYVHFDDAEVLSYMPGRPSCEPFRKYNTQGNGIYGTSPMSDATWQSFSNWCPGDVIDIRRINLGPTSAGAHKFRIEVPYAVFTGGQGYIPFSLYLQGKTSGRLAVGEVGAEGGISLYPNPAKGSVTIDGGAVKIKGIVILNQVGAVVYRSSRLSGTKHELNLGSLAPGFYVAQIQTDDGIIFRKLRVDGDGY